MKKLIAVVFLLLFSFSLAQPLDNCYKIYPKDADNLYMSAIKALNSDDRFDISEIQTKNGYILFLYGSKYYLLTLTKRYQNQTEIKILPQNNDLNQGVIVAGIVFSLIDNSLSKNLEQVR